MLANWNVPFRALVDAAPDGLLVCDPTGKLVLVNAQAERMFGYDHDELLGQNIEVLVPASVRGRHHHHVASYTAAPRLRPMGSNLELRGRRKDGSEYPVEISLSPITTERGTLIIAGVRDVSERRALEDDKKRAMGYLMSAVEAVQEAFLLFDEQDRVVLVNSAARTLAGPAGNAPITGRTFEDILRESAAAGLYDFRGETQEQWLATRLAYHRDPTGTHEMHTTDGRVLRVTERKTADRGTVTTIADISDDVRHAEELSVARELAEAASAAKSDFLSSMSHELRTPLNAILGFAQLLERDRKQPLNGKQRDRLGHVMRGGEHLLRLIDDVLDLARIESGRIAISSEPVAVDAVIAEVIDTLEPLATRGQISITPPESASDPVSVVADRTRLAQILMNFGSNAIKYGKPDGHVAFRLEPQKETLRITVSDDGIGIPDDKRGKVFEPFQRAGQETGPIQGTGIGLTISKRLAEMMNGTIGFTSTAGVGSAFWVELPLHRETVASGVPSVLTDRSSSPLATGARRHLVLYIEDNPSNIAFMHDVVDDLPSVELMTAASAELGLDLARAHHPRVIIMDINLPGMSGFEAARRLRDWPDTRDIPVIGLSAAALARDSARAKEAGFFRYLTKPVQVDALIAALEELLEHPR